LGVATAGGSFGQFAIVPFASILQNSLGDWHTTMLVLAALSVLMVPLAAGLREHREAAGGTTGTQSTREALREAFETRGFWLLTIGFFVCGFQVVFIGVHLPAYLADHGMPARVAVTALALVGLFNIVGTYTTGWLGSRMPKRYILSFIYFARAVVIALFVFLPLSETSVYLFAMALGVLWLSTVPPTNGIVAHVFGVRYLAMLAGFTFFSHQIGSFLGAWLGGKLYDATGSYDLVWYLSIVLGIAAGLINLPIDEKEIARPRVAAVRA
ncbi:MAG TPA: MFS transporter, partial [Casimicrobiaceae bacterium]|nr:MFS transporter [Casimicrobiaceae bacterium]